MGSPWLSFDQRHDKKTLREMSTFSDLINPQIVQNDTQLLHLCSKVELAVEELNQLNSSGPSPGSLPID